jgi:hypothetical protein
MPIDGMVLRAPWGEEFVYARTTDGARMWADDLAEMVREAEGRGLRAIDVWALNEQLGDELLERYKHRLFIQGPISAARDYALAEPPLKWIAGC